MNRLLITLLATVLPLSALATTAPTAPIKPPITSKAELDRYLRETPAGTSPLDALSPGARKRFLAELMFHPHGVGLSYGEPAAELTHAQMAALYSLFGEQKQAEDLSLGLTPEQKSRREAEREADARARGCAVQACPESDVERRFDELSIMAKPDFSLPNAQHVAAQVRLYDRLFGAYQAPERLRQLSALDLRLVTRATEFGLYAQEAVHVGQLDMDLAEMQRRGMAVDDDYTNLYRLLLSSRQFAKAKALARQHPGMEVGAIPAVSEKLDLQHHWPTALSIDPRQHRAMIRESYDPDLPLRIVAITDEGCHYCEEAASAIQADAGLRRLFAGHALWLASQSNDFDYAMAWNHRFPSQPIRIAWQNSEWPMLDWSALPAFYVFRNGHVVEKFLGWNGVKKFKRSLHDAGALR
jgi:hypothetical protein